MVLSRCLVLRCPACRAAEVANGPVSLGLCQEVLPLRLAEGPLWWSHVLTMVPNRQDFRSFHS